MLTLSYGSIRRACMILKDAYDYLKGIDLNGGDTYRAYRLLSCIKSYEEVRFITFYTCERFVQGILVPRLIALAATFIF